MYMHSQLNDTSVVIPASSRFKKKKVINNIHLASEWDKDVAEALQ